MRNRARKVSCRDPMDRDQEKVVSERHGAGILPSIIGM